MKKAEITLNHEWAETGIPPIGADCEYYQSEGDEWRKCRIVAYYFANVVAVDVLDSTAVCLRTELFRPMKTPEQIAAEERQQAIDEMMGLAERYGTVEGIMSALYDAGYRKTEVKK